ncbi:transglutaminase domain-containing protein [Saccharospirillum salsuginis]|uniref:Transglutaminase-like domain-containing protein n=1 Tax=Saccharospirillum salsuginis TaxID=418750 RepID=A0A918NIY7_9GAMM|nr:transglutaminase domain-containing protein [Saccharospirillum salsuginis]GGX73708.1 hypothetical protein GCM10007392_46490 [Saccharospirillum salsuginis]
MNISFFDIIRSRIAKWTALLLIFLIGVALYQYAYYTPAAIQLNIQPQIVAKTQHKTPAPDSKEAALTQSFKQATTLTEKTLYALENYDKNEISDFERILSRLGLGGPGTAELSALTDTLDEMSDLEQSAYDSFDDMLEYLHEINADEVIFDRHFTAVQQFKEALDPIKRIQSELDSADTFKEQEALLVELSEYLNEQQFDHSHQAEDFDKDTLPFGPRNGEAREPLTDLSSLQNQWLEPVVLASNTLTIDVLRGLSSPAAHPTSEDTVEVPEAPHTEAIKNLAASLNNDPIEIYNWVYNNIYSIPSYGSIQGAQYTLDLKAGNPFDTSSLLLALLRAADIPARFSYGTIEVPVDQAMNWVGGAVDPEAATNVMLQGGIPARLVTVNGQISHVEMEHIWVEAWVDFEPSRGLVNREGDHWIPMDPSFKQYDFAEGEGLPASLPFDADTIVDEFIDNVSIDESTGIIEGVNDTSMQNAMQSFQSDVEEYFETQNPDTTLEDILGLKDIPIKERAPLSAGLPYKVLDRSDQLTSIPDHFKHKFKVQLKSGPWGGDLINVTLPTIDLAGKDVAISYELATQSDIDLVNSYLPDVDESEDIELNDLPSQLPGYLIQLKPRLTYGENTTYATGTVTMGQELNSTLALYDPAFGWEQSNNKPVAGEYTAIGLDLQGISNAHLERIHSQLEEVVNTLESGNHENIDQDDIIGNFVQANIISYFLLNDVQDELTKRSANQLHYRAPSFGMFHTRVDSIYWFGIPRNVRFPGMTMDVDMVRSIGAAKDNDPSSRLVFNHLIGSRWSYMENWIPETLLSTDTEQVQGISAVKAIGLATNSGQRIFTLDISNADQLSSVSIDPDARQEIRSAIYSGKTVTVHEEPLNYNGWIGSGYIILDETGSSAYKISGGANGGEILKDTVGILSYLVGGDDASKSMKFLNSFAGKAFGGVGVFLELTYAGCGFFEAAMGAILVTMLGNYLSNLSLIFVVGVINPILLILIIFIIIHIISFIQSMVTGWIKNSCKK